MIRKNKFNGPIGIFDSGVGGLSVLREVHSQFPSENLIYIADQVHVPYGTRSREEVLGFSEGIIRYLLTIEAKLIIVACNTASAVALIALRKSHPDLPFVGMEPAVKPAVEDTSTGVVGVLATPATFQGDLYASTVERFARGVKILQDTCPGLVNQIEEGKIADPKTRAILVKALTPMMDEGVDEIVMGCTHYPFV
ncbi:MAG: glutamate racemase, partial [Anaerolineales bacterium]|nr:glutamate racemase [Anaerolineales bacterium]